MSTNTGSTAFTFPHPELTAITERPTIATTNRLRKELYDNAMSVETSAGGGENGHLGLVMPADKYAEHAGEAFEEPAHPGPLPDYAGLTEKQIIAANRLYDASLAAYKTCKALKVDLRKQIIAAVPKVYLPPDDPLFGYNKITPIQMLQHLTNTYGKMTPDELEANEKRLEQPFNVDDGIETLWRNISDIQTLATAAEEPIPTSAIIRRTLQVLEHTGLFTQGCRDWRKRPEAEHTLPIFIDHFNEEDVERRRQLTAQQAGFHGANHCANCVTTVTPAPPEHHQANATTTPGGPDVKCGTIMLYYCWTHGLNTNRNHTSATCKFPSEGHKLEATFTNRMEGSTKIMTSKPRGPGRRNRNTSA
jgi:hypothetical protein